MDFWHIVFVVAGGIKFTILVTLASVGLGIFIGLFMALFKMSKNFILKLIANVYIEVIRGTPLYVQIFLFHFGVASLITQATGEKFSFNIWTTGIVVCAINSGAYVAEIFRAGIQGVDKGQVEASRSLGMTHAQTMRYIVLPQAFKAVIPALGNEFVMLLKDTSLLSSIGAYEIMKAAQIYSSVHFDPFSAFTAAALVYLVLTFSLTRVINWYEKRLNTASRA